MSRLLRLAVLMRRARRARMERAIVRLRGARVALIIMGGR